MTVTLDGGERVIQLHRAAGSGEGRSPALVASQPLGQGAGEPLCLRIRADGGRYDFHYGDEPGEWKALQVGADGRILSTRTAGGFVGVTLGLYAYSEGT